MLKTRAPRKLLRPDRFKDYIPSTKRDITANAKRIETADRIETATGTMSKLLRSSFDITYCLPDVLEHKRQVKQ